MRFLQRIASRTSHLRQLRLIQRQRQAQLHHVCFLSTESRPFHLPDDNRIEARIDEETPSLSSSSLHSSLLSSVNQLGVVLSSSLTANREVWWLLEHITGVTVKRLQRRSLIKTLTQLSHSDSLSLLSLLQSRLQGCPLQYLIGTQPFSTFTFKVRPPTLIPRPETEQMVDWFLLVYRTAMKLRREAVSKSEVDPSLRNEQWPKTVAWADSILSTVSTNEKEVDDTVFDLPYRILDIGTGSGCIAISLAAHLRHSSVIGIDNQKDSIQLAKENLLAVEQELKQRYKQTARKCMLDCKFAEQDVFAPLPDPLYSPQRPYHLIVSNPPYIPAHEFTNLPSSVSSYEDTTALIASENGFAFYRRIINIASELLISVDEREKEKEKKFPHSRLQYTIPEVLLEVGSKAQSECVSSLLNSTGFDIVEVHSDLYNQVRWVAAARSKQHKNKIP